MKYFTKDWYELCQKTGFHLSLEEEKQAETFSESYFQQLYNSELHNWLTLREEIDSMDFNKEEAAEQFHTSFMVNQMHLKEGLRETILEQIADLRVFALYKATRNVINAVTHYCEENEKDIKTVSKNYREYRKQASKLLGEEIFKNLCFHDCTIIKSINNDKSLKLLIDNSGGFTNFDEVIFENFSILKQDGSLEDSWWLYEEVYKVHDTYEVHVLLQNRDMGLIDFIISAEQIIFKSNKNS